MSNADLLKIPAKLVSHMRVRSSLFEKNDSLGHKGALAKAAAGEAGEVQEALSKNAAPEVVSDEIRDILVFMIALYHRLTREMQLPNAIPSVNGYGKHSAALEQTREHLLDFAELPRPENDLASLYQIFAEVCSIALHSPEGIKVFTEFKLTIDKVLANYPPAIFSTLDPLTMREVETDDVRAFFDHRYKAMRMIRKVRTAGERPLTPADWRPHYNEIIDWRNSATALQKIEQDLKNRTHRVLESGIVIPSAESVQALSTSERTAQSREVMIFDAKRRVLLQ